MGVTDSLFIQLAVVIGLSAAFGYFISKMRLPLVVAYLLAGVLLSFVKVLDISHSFALTFFPDIGIAFVLFLVGMELDFKEIKNLGKPIIVAGLGQILISLLAGFFIAKALGFGPTESFYLGVGLSFSSTIVVVKLLLEKKDLTSLYGKLSVGILLLEDLVAIILLMLMTLSSSALGLGLSQNLPLILLLVKGILLIGLALWLSNTFLAGIFKVVARSSELLLLVALAWCFIYVAFALLLGFSVVIGAFLAGVALANSPFHYEIQGKVKPLRDFFVTLFFVYLGSQVSFNQVVSVLPVIIVFTLYALLIKPLIFMFVLGLFGFRKHTIFQTAINLSQISEFSLIVIVLGLKTGLVSESSLTAMALIGVISIIVSSIMIIYSRNIYPVLKPLVTFFEHTKLTHQLEKKTASDLTEHAVVVGGHLMGGEIVKFLEKEKVPFLILDFNPRVIQNLISRGIHAMYGDIGDPEILDFVNLDHAKLVVSTAPGVDDNLVLLTEVKTRRAETIVIVRATNVVDAEMLYQSGADYVIMPEIVAGVFMAQILAAHWPNLSFMKDRSEIELHKLARNHFALE
ncbi:cation:proton antiporter [Patescibacteria group bacterium]|nr:cation:proton antiporter [Patescibacteria group bacterium]